MCSDFERELTSLLNRYSYDNHANTPDFIMARYMTDCLNAFVGAMDKRDCWVSPSYNTTLERSE